MHRRVVNSGALLLGLALGFCLSHFFASPPEWVTHLAATFFILSALCFLWAGSIEEPTGGEK